VPPRRLGRYRVLEVIGTGAFATVVRARDERLDADVAVKLLAENHSLTPEIRERFVTEGQLLRRVQSLNVIGVHDLGETEAGQPFLVLDLARGGDLGARRAAMADRQAVSIDDVVAVAGDLAAALSALHAENVVHRDLTPGNLLISSPAGESGRRTGVLANGERVVLADLGLSKDLAAASGLTVGTGTAGFTPPEQGTGGWVDPRADIWSASAVVVWLVLGRPPDAKRAWAREMRRLGWPEALTTVLARGLQDDPAKRHRTADDWVAEVRRATAPPPPAVEKPEGTGKRRRRPSAKVLAVVAAAVAVALLAAGWWAGRFGPGSDRQQVQTLDGGDVRVSSIEGDLSVAMVGPTQAEAGSTATFVAEVEGAESWFWVAPDGRLFEDVERLTVETRSSGLAEVTLVAVAADGRRSAVEHEFTVRDAP
jgi:tRNA A-37 threonylcarbamoyl transferase component Bud32